MFGTTMLLTVGHALERAKDEGMPVRLNVGGEWITGRVINNDGHGVAVLEANGDMCVFRPDAICGVRIPFRSTDARPAPAASVPVLEPDYAAQT